MANYSYNGYLAPAPPLYDSEKYPFAWYDYGHRAFGISTGDLYVDTDSLGSTRLFAKNKCNRIFWELEGDSWVSNFGEMEIEAGKAIGYGLPVWANFDVYNADGTLYLAASDPIPVTTAAPIDPTAFMQGWLVGRRIATMRGKVQGDHVDAVMIGDILFIKNCSAVLTDGVLEVK